MMTPERASTKDLCYAVYRYEHCCGHCVGCPCYNEDCICTQVYHEIKRELNRRKERVQDENS